MSVLARVFGAFTRRRGYKSLFGRGSLEFRLQPAGLQTA